MTKDEHSRVQTEIQINCLYRKFGLHNISMDKLINQGHSQDIGNYEGRYSHELKRN